MTLQAANQPPQVKFQKIDYMQRCGLCKQKRKTVNLLLHPGAYREETFRVCQPCLLDLALELVDRRTRKEV